MVSRVGCALVALWVVLAGSAQARAQECVPACRSGYVCHEGRCIDACNPACPVGQRCEAGGVCVDATLLAPVPQVSTGYLTVSTERVGSGSIDTGWAIDAGVWGIVNVAVALGVATAQLFIEDQVARGGVGIATVGYLAATGPLVVAGGASSEGRGATGLEVVGWITYGIGVTGGIVLSALNLTDDGPEDGFWYFIPLGMLAISHGLFAGDALIAGSRSSELSSRPALAPSFALVPDSRGGLHGIVSLSGAF